MAEQIYIQTDSEDVYNVAQYTPSTGDYTITGTSGNPNRASATSSMHPVHTLRKSDYKADDSNITIEEVYNQIVLTCNIEEIEDVVDDPTDPDQTRSPFTNKQKFCEEYVAWGEGTSAFSGFQDMIRSSATGYDGAYKNQWFVQVKKSLKWKFNGDKYIDEMGFDQTNVLEKAGKEKCVAFLASFGKSETSPNNANNQIQGKVNMQDYVVISICGNGANDSNARPNENDIRTHIPVAEYVGDVNGGLLSPVDDKTTNYIVLSGKIRALSCGLMGTQPRNNTWGHQVGYPELKYDLEHNEGAWVFSSFFTKYWHQTVDLKDNGDSGYYFQRFFKAHTPDETPHEVTDFDSAMVLPPVEWNQMRLRYSYSGWGDETDRIHKLPLLACELKVGDKYCCEIHNSDGTSDYVWRRLEDCPSWSYQGSTNVGNFITIGANPAIDDFIIGKEYSLANNVTGDMGIDAEGIAIKIKASDQLTGKVEFKILGPIAGMWDEWVRIHPTLFRHTDYYTDSYNILANMRQIMIKDFKMEIYTDSASINNQPDDQDLVYMSQESGVDTISKLDDQEFDLVTALTSEEAAEKGLKNSIKLNNPYINKEPLRSVYNTYTHATRKPEEHFVVNQFNEYSNPRVIYETTVDESIAEPYNVMAQHYVVPSLNSPFFVQGYTWNARKATTTLTLKEG